MTTLVTEARPRMVGSVRFCSENFPSALGPKVVSNDPSVLKRTTAIKLWEKMKEAPPTTIFPSG